MVDRIGGQGSLWAIGRPPVYGDFVQSRRPQDNRGGLRSASWMSSVREPQAPTETSVTRSIVNAGLVLLSAGRELIRVRDQGQYLTHYEVVAPVPQEHEKAS